MLIVLPGRALLTSCEEPGVNPMDLLQRKILSCSVLRTIRATRSLRGGGHKFREKITKLRGQLLAGPLLDGAPQIVTLQLMPGRSLALEELQCAGT